MKKKFGCNVGLSDHTLDIATSIAAVALGATAIEKHFVLSRKIKSPDSFFSLEPNELSSLVKSVRITEKSLGRIHYGLTSDEVDAVIFRRSLFVVKDIKKGEVFSEKNIRSIRPGFGIKPKYYNSVLGRKAKVNIVRGTPLLKKMIG
jgi:pseudaminic acid synthase